MSGPLHTDLFTVVNGPEDGAEFAITRTPFYVGNDSSCAIVLRLDDSVLSRHAQVDVGHEAYRIRSLGAAPVYVDGRRAGMMRSRRARNGSYVQIGNTLLVVECSCDGLASRSRGIGLPSDLGWAFRIGSRRLFRGFWLAWRMSQRMVGRLLGSWLLIVVVVGALYFFVPAVRYWINGALQWIRFTILNLLS